MRRNKLPPASCSAVTQAAAHSQALLFCTGEKNSLPLRTRINLWEKTCRCGALPVQLGHGAAAVPWELEHEEPPGHKRSREWQGVTSVEERWLAEENWEHR